MPVNKRIVAVTASQRVVAQTADNDFVEAATDNEVVASTTIDVTRLPIGINHIVARGAHLHTVNPDRVASQITELCIASDCVAPYPHIGKLRGTAHEIGVTAPYLGLDNPAGLLSRV